MGFRITRLCTAVAAAALCFSAEARGQTLAPNFTVEGRLYDNTGAPLNSNSVDIVLEILNYSGLAGGSLNATPCVLYAESWPGVNVSSSDSGSVGVFALPLGKGTALSGSFSSALFKNPTAPANSTFVNENTSGTTTYTGACTVTISPLDQRVVRIKVREGSSLYEALNPDTFIGTSPVAMVADSLQGYSAGQFLMTNANTSLSQGNVETVFTNTNFANLMALLDGTSSAYLNASGGAFNFSSDRLTNVAAPVAGTDAANKAYVDSSLAGHSVNLTGLANGQTLVWNSTSSSWQAGDGGGVQSVTAGTGLGGGTITSSGSLYVDVGTTSGKILQLNLSSQIPAVDGSQLTNLTIPANSVTLSKLNVGGTGGLGYLIMSDAVSGTNLVYKGCAVNQVLQWAAGGWACTDVAALLGNNGVVPGSYGSSTQVAQLAVDAQGLVTAVSSVNIAFPVTFVAGHTGNVILNTTDINGLGTIANWDYGSGFAFAGTLINVDVGTAAGKILQLNASAQIPAVDGSLLAGVSAAKLQQRNISAVAPIGGQVLAWNAGDSQWEPADANAQNVQGRPVSSATPVPGEVLTYNSSGAWDAETVPGTLSGLTSGRITLSSSVNSVTDSANLTFNPGTSVMDLNGSAEIGTTGAPTAQLDVSGSSTGTTAAFRTGATTMSSSIYNLVMLDTIGPSANSKNVLAFAHTGIPKWEIGNDINGLGAQNFFIYDAQSAATRLYINSSGLVGIGTSAPQTQLSVGGDFEVGAGDATTSPTSAIIRAPMASGGTDINGASLIFESGLATGAGNSGDMYFEGAPAGSSGVTTQSAAPYLTIKGGGSRVGAVGIGTISPLAGLDISTTGTLGSAVIVPRDTTANRPSGVNGMIRYNSNLSAFEVFANANWQTLATDSSANFSNDVTMSGAGTSLTVQNSETVFGNMNVAQNLSVAGNTFLDTNNTGVVAVGSTPGNTVSLDIEGITFIDNTVGAGTNELVLNTTGIDYAAFYQNGNYLMLGGTALAESAPTSPVMTWDVLAGNVGIGTPSPASTLQVNGAITNTVYTYSGAFTCGSSSINFGTGNFQRLSPSTAIAAGSCTVPLINLVPGGSYTLVMTGNAATNAVTYTFSGSGYTFKFLPANAPTTAGRDSIYTFVYDGVTVYVTWSSGYQ